MNEKFCQEKHVKPKIPQEFQCKFIIEQHFVNMSVSDFKKGVKFYPLLVKEVLDPKATFWGNSKIA